MQAELLYFRWSHYNEKARWALEHKGIPWRPRQLLPGRHAEIAHRLTGQTALPILILDGIAINDSTRIIGALEQVFPGRPLYPRDPVQRQRALELEEIFDEELGPHLRRVVFAACFPHSIYMAHLFDAEQPLVSRWLYRGVLHLLKPRLAERIKIDPESVAQSWRHVDRALDHLEREIQPNGYLAGDGFSVADLTAAAMLSVAVLPPEFPSLPRKALPRSVQRVVDRIAARSCSLWARGIYARHRNALRAAVATAVRSSPMGHLAEHVK